MATRAKFGESGESAQNRLANVGKSGESGTFLKKAILASTVKPVLTATCEQRPPVNNGHL
jgi:hypothetical protein